MRAVLTLAALPLAAMSAPQASDPAIERGRVLSDWASVESITALTQAANPPLKAAIANGGGAAGFVAAISAAAGPQTRVVDEVALTLNGLTTYSRLAVHERGGVMLTTVAWTADGVVTAAGVRPSALPVADTAPALAVRPPFAGPRNGAWLTVWGGTNAARNYHVVSPSQARAYDFLVVKDGRSYAGPADQLASYHCWGQSVLAAADGVVTEAVGDLPDQAIGASDPANAAGNHVVIAHAPDRHSLVAHLQRGSVTVKPGERVRAGAVLGRCGNSGNTSEPHVHFHLQTGATFANPGTAISASFTGLTINGRSAVAGEPLRGQTIMPGHQR